MVLQTLRAVFGFALLLFIPGYAASWALFPKEEELDFAERIALSFGLSISLVVLATFALNYGLKLPINLVTTLSTILLITLASSLVYILRAAKPAARKRKKAKRGK